jgi:uncharacterized protein
VDLAFPYHLDNHGETATAERNDHIRQMLEQLLLTRPGERVNRPDFGCGLPDLLFGPSSPEAAAAARVTVAGSVQRWLGDVIELTELEIEAGDDTLTVNLTYRLLATGELSAASLTVPGTG